MGSPASATPRANGQGFWSPTMDFLPTQLKVHQNTHAKPCAAQLYTLDFPQLGKGKQRWPREAATSEAGPQGVSPMAKRNTPI
jgi:hypothetical protein